MSKLPQLDASFSGSGGFKLGVRLWDYPQDRVRGLGKIPRLADLIRQKARQSTASNR